METLGIGQRAKRVGVGFNTAGERSRLSTAAEDLMFGLSVPAMACSSSYNWLDARGRRDKCDFSNR